MMIDMMGRGAGGAVTGAVLQGVAPIVGGAVNQVAQRTSGGAAQREAQAKIAEALLRDATLKQNVTQQAATRMGKLGPEARIADAGGENTRRLLDTLATLPGQTKQATERAIRERIAGRGERLMTAANQALGTRNAAFSDTLEALAETRSRNSGPLYKAIEGVTVTIDDETAQLLSRAHGIDAEARKLFRSQTGTELPPLSSLTAGATVPFKVLDSLKQSLYDSAQAAKRAGSNQQGAAWDSVRTELINKLDDLSPKINGQSAYKMARDEFAGYSQMMDAAELGRKAMRGDLLEVRNAMRGMGQSETEAFRVGVLEGLRDKAGRQAGQTEILSMWKNPATQERLRALFGNDYRKFASAVAAEERLKGLESVGRGSQTASRLFGAGDLDMSPLTDAASTLAAAKAGSPLGVLAGAQRFAQSVQMPEPVRDRMGSLLLSRNPDDLRAMAEIARQVQQNRAAQAAGLGLLGGQSGGMIGGLLSQ
jgi:hypothetical protein